MRSRHREMKEPHKVHEDCSQRHLQIHQEEGQERVVAAEQVQV